DRLHPLFRNASKLFANGVVVWGQIVQANGSLFRDGDNNSPGEIVFSLADGHLVRPHHLQTIASEIFDLKGTTPEEAGLRAIADHLTNERTRVYGLPVPRSLSPRIQCRISTTFFVRKHLPNGRLCSGSLPLVVNPNEPHFAMPLPQKYWPEELVE